MQKQARIRVTVAVKASDTVADLVDLAGLTLPLIGALGGGPVVILQMPLELLYRLAWASSDELVVPVIDWEECTGVWKGRVTYAETTTISNTTRITTADGGVTDRKNTTANGYTGTIDINNGTATATMSSTSRGDEYSIRYGKCHSYDRRTPLLGQGYTIVQTDGGDTKTTAAESKDALGLPSLGFPEFEATSGYEERNSLPCMDKKPEPVIRPPTKVIISARSVQLEGAQPDADDPNRMHGTKTYNLSTAGKTVITWGLARCTDMR